MSASKRLRIAVPIALTAALALGFAIWHAGESNELHARQHVEALRKKYPDWFSAVQTFEGRLSPFGYDEVDTKPVLALMPPEIIMIHIEREDGGDASLSAKYPNQSGYTTVMAAGQGYCSASGSVKSGGHQYEAHVLEYDDDAIPSRRFRVTLFLTP